MNPPPPPPPPHPRVEWAEAGRALPGQDESGDLALVVPLGAGALVALIDGLGHGPEAARAARFASATLRADPTLPLDELFRRCHAALRHTRGTVMTAARFGVEGAAMSWLAVGNVEGVLLREAPLGVPARETVTLRGGVVGYTLPTLREAALPLRRGDTLVLTTDGVRGDAQGRARPELSCQAIAEGILSERQRDADDALVLVARYLGDPP